MNEVLPHEFCNIEVLVIELVSTTFPTVVSGESELFRLHSTTFRFVLEFVVQLRFT